MLHCSCVSEAVPASSTGVGKPGLIAPASAAVPPAPMYLTSFAGVATDATFERSAASDKGPVVPPNLISNSKVSGSGDSRFNSIHNFIHSSSTRRNSRSSTRRLVRSHGGEDFISSSHTADCMCAICGGSDGNALTSSSLSRHRRRHVSCRCRERATPRSSAACDKSPSNGSSSSRNSNEKLLHSIGQRHKRKQSATQQPPRRQDQEEDEEEGDEEEEEERKAALLRAKRERQRIASKNYRDRKRLLQLHAALAEVPPDALPFAFLALSRVAAVATAAAKAEGGAEGTPFLPAAPETSVQQQQLNASNAAATDVFSSTPRYADTCSCPCQPCTMHSVCLPQHQQSCTLHEQQRYRDWHVGQPLLLEQQPHLLRQQMLNRQQPLTMQEQHAWLQQWSRREREWQHFQDLSKVEQQQACQPELLLQQQWRLEPNKLHSMSPHMQALPPHNSLRMGKEASFKHVFQSSEEPLRRFSSGIFHYPRGSGDSSVAELNSLFPPTPTIPGPGVEAKFPPVVVSPGPAAGAVIADVAPSTTPSISEDARLLSSPSLAAGVANSASTPATLNQESAVVGASCFPPPWSTASQPTATSASAVQTSGAAAAANAAAGKGTGRTVAAGRKSIVSTVSATVGLTNSSRRAMMFGAGSKLLTQAAKKAAAAAAAPSALSSFGAAGAAGTEAGSATSKRKDCSAKKEEETAQANPLFGASLPLELYGDPLGLKNRCTITRNSSTERCMQWKRFKGIDIDLLKQYVRNRSSSNWGSSSLSSISHLRRHSCLMESVRKMLDATSSCSKFLSWRSSFFARSSGPSASEYMNRRGISNRDSDDSNTFNDNCAKSNSNSRRIRERESISLLGQRGRRGYCSSSKQCSAFTSFSHTNFSLHSSSRRITVASRRSFFHSECADDEEKSNITNHSNDSNTDNSNSSSYVMVSRDHSSSDTTSSTSLMGCSTTDDPIPVSPDLLRIPCSNCREEEINKRSYSSSSNSSTRENSRGNGRRHSRNSTNRSNSLAAGASTGSDANHVPLCVSSLSSSSNVYAMGLPCTALQSSRNSSALTQSCYPYSPWMETESPVTPNTSHVLQQIDALHCESTCQAEARPAPADFLQVMPAPAANTAVTAAVYPGLPVVHPAAAAEAAVAEQAATEIQAAVASTLLPSIVSPAAPSSLEETLGGKEAEGREAILISSSTSSSIASSDGNSNDHPQQQRAGLPISRAFAEERAGEGAATGPPTTLLQSITSLKQTCTFKPGDASASAAAAPTAAPRLSTVIAPTAGAEVASAGNTATAEGGGHGISETETAALASGPAAGEANAQQQQQQRLYGGVSNSQKENVTASLLTPTSSAVSKECSDYAVDEPHLQQTDYAAFFASKAAVVNLLPDSAAALPAIAPPPVDVALLRCVALPPPAPHPLGAAAPVAALFPAAAVSATPDEAVDGKAVAAPIVASAPGFAAVPAATGFAAASVGSTAPAFAAGAAAAPASAAPASAAPASAAVLAVATATAPPFVAVPAAAGAPPTAVSVGVMPACAAAGAGRRLVPCLDGDDASLNPLFTGTLEEEHEGEMSSADAAAAIMGELKGEEDTLEKYNERRSSIRGRGSSDAAAGSPFGVVVSRRRSNNTLRRSSAAAGARRRQPHQQKNVYSPSSYTSPSKQQQPSRLSGSSRDSFLFHSVRSSDEESVVYMLAGVDAEAQERRHSKTSTSSSNSNSSSTSTSISNSSSNGKWGGEGRKRDRRTSAADRGRSSRKQREGAGLASRNNSKRRNERERATGGRAKACIGSGAAGDSNRRGGIAAAVARIYRQILSLYTPAGQKQAHALMWEMLGAAAADTNQQQLHGMQQQEEKPHTPGTGVPLSNVSVSEQLEQQQVHQQSLESRHHFTVQQQQLLQQQTALINSTVIHQQQQQLQISRQDLKGQQFDQQRPAQQQLQLHYPPAFLQMNESLPYQHQQLLQQHYREQQQQQLHVEHQQQPANEHLRQRSYRIQDQWMYQHPLQQHRQEKRGGQEQQHFQLHRQQPGLRRELHDGTGQGEQQELQGRSTPEQLHQEQLHKEQLYTQQQQLCGNKGRLEPYMGQQQYVSQQQLQHLFQQHLQQNWQLHYEQLSEQRSHQQPHQELCYYLQQQEGAQEQRYHTQTPRDCHEGFGGRLEQQEQQSGQQEKQEGNNLQDGQAECTEMQKQQMPTQQ